MTDAVMDDLVVATPKRRGQRISWRRTFTITKTDLKQLLQSRDFLLPLGIIASLFFVFMPTALLLSINSISGSEAITRISETLDVLPAKAQESILGDTPSARAQYALAVYLFAPLAVIVPLTISTAIGAATMVGERERGTGEFLAHSPAGTKEIYIGKLIASFIPGYVTTFVGFTIYALIVNTIVGPKVGGWFFPNQDWWLMMFWFVPPFLVLAMSLVLRLSARVRSTIAAQQASSLVTLPMIILAYSQSTGTLLVNGQMTLLVGLLAWIVAIISLRSGMKAVQRARLLGVAIA